jgi:hypothetical protein
MIGLIVVLTASTAYIHFWVGGTMLMLNSLGYAGLIVLVVGSALFYRKALPLVLAALAAYAFVTIVGWLILGPYFDVAYLAKAIEIVLISSIAFYLWRTRPAIDDSVAWARALVGRVLGGRGSSASATSANEE